MNDHAPTTEQSAPTNPPEFVPRDSSVVAQSSSGDKTGVPLKWIILMIVWPVPMLLLSVVLYALLAFMFGQVEPEEGALFADASAFRVGMNVFLFLVGAATVLLGPISFVTGLVLLIMRLSGKAKQQP